MKAVLVFCVRYTVERKTQCFSFFWHAHIHLGLQMQRMLSQYMGTVESYHRGNLIHFYLCYMERSYNWSSEPRLSLFLALWQQGPFLHFDVIKWNTQFNGMRFEVKGLALHYVCVWSDWGLVGTAEPSQAVACLAHNYSSSRWVGSFFRSHFV